MNWTAKHWLLAVPAVITGLAIWRGGFMWSTAVTLSCCMVVLLYRIRPGWSVIVIGAWFFSIVGDYFLSHRHVGGELFLPLGIAGFGVAHLCYLGYALHYGRLRKLPLAILILILPVFYYWCFLFPVIGSKIVATAVWGYIMLSCLSLAAALGMKFKPVAKIFFVIGISLIMFSDLIISMKEFLQCHVADMLIMPTYYLAQAAVAVGVCMKLDADED